MDWNHVKQRRQQISDELVYVRMHPDVKVLESYVPLSAARGGNPNFRRDDLLYELTWEDKQLAMRSRLDALDRELHDAHATNKEYMEARLGVFSELRMISRRRRGPLTLTIAGQGTSRLRDDDVDEQRVSMPRPASRHRRDFEAVRTRAGAAP